MNQRSYRDIIRLFFSLLFFPFYLPHIYCFFISKNRNLIISDVKILKDKLYISLNTFLSLLYFLHNDSFFRVIFYHRIGPKWKLLIGWYRKGCRDFIISSTTIIGEGFQPSHSYATILNAEKIGNNFSFRHCTTLGNKLNDMRRPIIGDNVILGASVTIIGDIRIGSNVIVGAGSVVVRDIPDNSIAVGNPAKVIKKILN